MAWTKMTFYMSIILITIITFVSMEKIGTDAVNNPNLDLSEDSVDYILKLKGLNQDSNYNSSSNRQISDTTSKGILDAEDNRTVSTSSDFLSTLFIKKERAQQPTNYFKLIYHLPTTIIVSLGLPVSSFAYIISPLIYAFFIAMLIMIWYFIRT